ncbi:2Fe-2S iron-sulfur cluster-binding protein [Leptolyngbya ohadii]|uniref:2Fe-2S iron-sulfur cluster-binding protein n=1 Tax=Leptolyngbya ohadii TaxID=1962290 RepID=UPI000B59CC39|nr:2Fe-2S iron-sulfur cluster-binding protein [Leptolyngbya ohadii]
MSYRLPTVPGEWIDRTQLIQFSFEGRQFTGYAGDTIASALWASGQKVLGRSFKYHRPRGILSFANHDVNTLMQSGEKLNVRADVTAIESGMAVEAVNTFGGVEGDRASFLNFLSPFLPVGFYYKTFNNKKLFPFWERLIRRTTGLGRVDFKTPWTRTPKRYDFCDVLVIGAGTSGLSAALTAAELGADVVIADENAKPGGTGLYQLGDARLLADETLSLIEAITNHPKIRLYTGTIAAGYYADFWIPLIDGKRMTKMRAKSVIVASGAYEQPAVFRNNDLPGVMLASAAQRLIYRYAVKPMHRAIVLTANQDGYRAALDLLAHGIEIGAIVDLRSEIPGSPVVQTVRDRGIAIYPGHAVYEAKANPQGDGVCAAVICPIDSNYQPQINQRQTIACDGILMSVGWAGAANLLYQAGTKMRFDDRLQQFVPDLLPPGIFACGRVKGVYQVEHKRRDGERAGRLAIAYLSGTEAVETEIPAETECPSHPWAIVPHPKGKNFVDFDEDLQYKDFPNAIQEGFDNIELLKRFTTVGMGPSQGKHSNMNALQILAKLTGKTPGQVGTTTARPFFHPVPMSHLAGRGFTPERRTPLDDRHTALNAKWMPAGQWRRPEYYQQPNQSRETCIRQEVLAVRQRVGLIDVGTLGKLEIRGKDAAAFLERVYTGRYANLKIGMTRYALMLDESGVVIDDGVIARLGEDHFYFTTTTSNAAGIYRELSRLNTMWRMDCGLVNLTGARSAVNLAGPLSRKVLSQLTDLDLSAEAFPYLAVRQANVANIPALLMRVGFVGEWGYEIHVAAQDAPALWDALIEAGKPYNIQPFGVEAQRLLRLEKGHLIVGQDTDGLTTPYDANLTWAVKADKPFFIGQRSLQVHAQRSPKQVLVGFTLNSFSGNPPQECHLIIHNGDLAGRITSIAYSPSIDCHIGLAYIKSGLSEVGTEFEVKRSDGSMVGATVTKTPFYDPENARQKVEVSEAEDSVPNRPPSPPILGETEPMQEYYLQKAVLTTQSPPLVGDLGGNAGSHLTQPVTLTDVSLLARFGVKGAGAAVWLQTHGLPIPDRPNSWLPLENDGRIARLGLTEFLIEGEIVTQLQSDLNLPPQVYPVLRQDLAIVLTGESIYDLFAQTCNVNMRSFNPGDRPVILTSMIGVSVTVAIEDTPIPQSRLWCDSTYRNYVLHTLSEIVSELDSLTNRPPDPPILGETEPTQKVLLQQKS